MHRILLFIPALLISGAAAFAQAPVIGPDAVVAATSYLPSGLPNSGIARGSFFIVSGSNLGPAAIVVNNALPYKTTIGGTSVSVSVGGTTTQALMYYSSAGQISGILPSGTPAGTGTATVTYNGQTSASAPIKVLNSNFGIFTLNQGGTGPAVVTDVNYAVNTLRKTVKPGDTVTLWGSGLGAVTGDEASGAGLPLDLRSADNLTIHVYVGGKDASIAYAGRTSYVGLDQINFVVPNGLSGCYVPVAVSVNGVLSNHGSISVDPNAGTCSDPFGLTPAQIQKAATGKLSVGSLLLTRLSVDIGLGVITEDTANAKFYQFDGSNPASSPEFSPSVIGLASFGSCNVTTCHGTTCVPTSNGISSLPKLDAGSKLTANRLDGTGVVSVNKQASGFYSGDLGSSPIAVKDNDGNTFPLSNYLLAGQYAISGTGGADVQAFSAPITVPGLLNWTNEVGLFGPANTSPILDRTKDLTLTWSGGSASDYVSISASSATCLGTVPAAPTCDDKHPPVGNFYVSATITCQEKASAGTFTIPAWLLSALPASSVVNFGAISQDGGAALIGLYNISNTFSSNLDVSLANSIVLNGKNVKVN